VKDRRPSPRVTMTQPSFKNFVPPEIAEERNGKIIEANKFGDQLARTKEEQDHDRRTRGLPRLSRTSQR